MGELSGGSEMARPQRPLHHHIHKESTGGKGTRNIPFPPFFLKPTIVVIFDILFSLCHQFSVKNGWFWMNK